MHNKCKKFKNGFRFFTSDLSLTALKTDPKYLISCYSWLYSEVPF